MGKSNGTFNGGERSARGNQRPVVSERKLKANRQNARKSTGPKTPQGKAYSRRNALKHGFFAKSLFTEVLVLREDPKEFEKLHSRLVEHFEPVGPAEEFEVENLAVQYWRRFRVWRCENAELHNNKAHNYVQMHNNWPKLEQEGPEMASVVKLVDDAMKQFQKSGEISKELEEKILAVDPSMFSREAWLDVKVIRALLRVSGHRRLAKAPARLLQVRWEVVWSKDHLDRSFSEIVNMRYDQVAIPPKDVLDRILRYEAANDRNLTRALDRLERLQSHRKRRVRAGSTTRQTRHRGLVAEMVM